MIETIKKTLLAGIGAAVVTKEKVQDALDDYVRQGKLKADDARIIAEKIAERGRREFDEMSQQASAKAAELFNRQDSAVLARLAALEARVATLEAIAAIPSTSASAASSSSSAAGTASSTRNGEP